MARRKNAPESIRVKHGLSERLRLLRTEFYGERGGPDLARTLGIPVRTWYNYENGVTVPAEIILRIVEMTSVEPVWLLRGEGAKFRANPTNSGASGVNGKKDCLADSSVATLLRTALERLEDKQRSTVGLSFIHPFLGHTEDGHPRFDLEPAPNGHSHVEKHSNSSSNSAVFETQEAEGPEPRKNVRTMRVSDDSMAPIVAEGAHVAYSDPEPVSEAFHDKLVVAWIDGSPCVRWFQHCGRFALLRAENRAVNPPSSIVDLEGDKASGTFHRVLWISTPH
jgi:hypothetical protein